MGEEDSITICLVMIIKNEGAIMPRMLNSVKDLIDDIVISDTGSTDDTEDVVRKTAEELGKKIYIDHTPFKNFGYNRSVALDVAKRESKSTFLLFLDADMVLIVGPKFDKSVSLRDGDIFRVMQKGSGLEYYNSRLARRNINDLKYVEPTHEYLSHPADARTQKLSPDAMYIDDIGDGKCKDDKLQRDYRLLTEALLEEPNRDRCCFYLAGTCRDMGRHEEAIKYYRKRIELGGWIEEVYMSYCYMARCFLQLGDVKNAEKTALESYLYNPNRAEALYSLCEHHRIKGNHKKALLFYTLGSKIKYPHDDVLFIESEIYHYLFDYEYSIIAYYCQQEGENSSPFVAEETLRNIFRFMCKMKPYRIPCCKIENTFQNLKFYVKLLPERFPRREIPFVRIPGYHPSSTSILRLNKNKICYFTRQVNYKIRSDGSYDYPGFVDTKSSFHIADNDGKILSEPIEVPLDPFCISWNNGQSFSTVRGLEDIRIFTSSPGNEHTTIYGLGTTRQFSSSNDCGKSNTMALCVFNINEPKIHSIRPLAQLQDCEKNWAPIIGTEKCVYSWSPLRIVDLSTSTHETLQYVDTMKENELPHIFQKFRGSSSGVPVYEGNSNNVVKSFWFVVHSVHYQNPRIYCHFLVKMNPDYKIVGVTVPFHFDENNIEYCLGLLVDRDVFKLSYSVNDNCSREIIIPNEWVVRNFIPLL